MQAISPSYLLLVPVEMGSSQCGRFAGQAEIGRERGLECTANMCSGITVEMHLKNCNFEKLQFFTVDLCSLYFLQVKNCKFNTIFM